MSHVIGKSKRGKEFSEGGRQGNTSLFPQVIYPALMSTLFIMISIPANLPVLKESNMCLLSEKYICTADVVCVKYEVFCCDPVHGLFGSMYTWQVFLSFQTLNCFIIVSVDCNFQMSILINLRGLSKLAKGFTKLIITKSALTSSPLH